MADPPCIRPGGKADLHDDLRPDPGHQRIDGVAGEQQIRGRARLQVGQEGAGGFKLPLGEAGSDTAGIVQAVLIAR